MPDNHGSTDTGELSANRRSMLRKLAAGATGLTGIAAMSGSGAAHQDCDGEVVCRGGRQYVEVTCDDGHEWDINIGTTC